MTRRNLAVRAKRPRPSFSRRLATRFLRAIFARRAGKSTSWPALGRPWPSLKSRRGARRASVGQRPLLITGNNRKSSSLRAGSCGRDISTVVSVVLMSLRSASQGSARKSITCPARLRREHFAGHLPLERRKQNGRRVVEIGGIAIVCKIIWRHDDGRRRAHHRRGSRFGGGTACFDIVGLPDTAVRESKERVRTAIRNSGIQLRQEKVTINLARGRYPQGQSRPRPANRHRPPRSVRRCAAGLNQDVVLCSRALLGRGVPRSAWHLADGHCRAREGADVCLCCARQC